VIWLALALLSLAALTPLALSLRGASAGPGRRDAALALHRAQLAELDRERDEGRIGAPEHAAAVLEVQRRLLAAAAEQEAGPGASSRTPVLMAVALVPMAALALYMISGIPDMPAMPLAERIAFAKSQPPRKGAAEEADLIAQLRERISQLDPSSDQAREGYVLLGSAEGQRGDMAATADAWRHALKIRFDPTLAVETAEAITEVAGGKPDAEAIGLFRRALAEAPPDAPWRPMAVKRLVEATGAPLAGASAPAIQ
jgi:cytochrome c-type biogenesis protein CcmH